MSHKFNRLFQAIFLTLNLGMAEVFANPEGGEIVSGVATLSNPNTNTLVVDQTSQKAIINWQTFDVNQNEAVQFHTPTANSITLNRVLSGNASQILGDVSSNGQVWIINQNGIFFGKNAQVNVAGLVASTMDIQNSDFEKGNYAFSQSNNQAAEIINQGHLAADNGYVAILAPQINNSGLIEANAGTVALEATQEATLSFAGNQLLNIALPENTQVQLYDNNGKPVALTDSGTIKADGGHVILTAQGMEELLDESINLSGVIEADTAHNVNGNIVLTSSQQTILNNATINAQGADAEQTGGNVEVLGQDVGLFGNTSINASGTGGGGDIHIGRDTQDPNAFEAQETIIDPSVALNADATQSGNGGFIETSGDMLQENSTNISTAGAQNGTKGTWLLDPYDIIITNSQADSTNGWSGGNTFNSASSAVEPSYVNTNTLQNNLNTNNVLIETGGASGGAGNITVSSAINSTSTNTLSLDAAGGVSINATITLDGPLNITAAGNVMETSPIVIGASGATTSINAGTGNIMLTAASNNFDNNTVTLTGSLVQLTDANTTGLKLGNISAAGNLIINAAGTITQTGGDAITMTSGTAGVNTATFNTSNVADAITLGNSGNNFNQNTVSIGNTGAAGMITLEDSNSTTLAVGTIDGTSDTLIARSGDSIDITGTVTGTTSVTLSSNTGTIETSGSGTLATPNITFGTIGSVTLTDSQAITGNGSSSGDNVSLADTANGGISLSNSITALSNITLEASGTAAPIDITSNLGGTSVNLSSGSGVIETTGSGTLATPNITFNTTGNVTLTDNTALTGNGVSTGNNISFTDSANGGMSLSNTVTAALNLTLDTSGTAAPISQSTGSLVAGTTDLTATGSIDLADASNSFGYLTAGAGSTLTLVDGNVDGIELALSSVGAISVTSAGLMTLDNSISTAGQLELISAAGINQATGNITANNTVLESTGSSTLTQTGGNYGTISTTGSGVDGLSVTETDATPIVLGAITDTGNLSVITNNAGISGSGALDITGTTTLNAGTSTISATSTSNSFGGIVTVGGASTAGGTVNLGAGSGGIEIAQAASTLAGLTININNGAVTQSGALDLNVAGATTTINTNSSGVGTPGAITLTNADNDFGNNMLTLNGGATQIVDADMNGLTLGNIKAAGDLTISGAAGIMQAGSDTITMSGTPGAYGATFNTIGNGSANLGNANNFNQDTVNVRNTSGFSSIILNDSNTTGLKLGGIVSNAGNVTLNAAGGISQTGALFTGSSIVSLTAGNDIVLTNVGNNFTGSVTAIGNNVSLVDSGTLKLDEVTAHGNVTLAAEQLNNVGGSDAITTRAGDAWQIYLTNLNGNTFDSLVSGNQAIWGTSYGTSISQSGDRYIFGTAETLAITPESTPFSVSKEQGATANLPTPTQGTNYQIDTADFVNANTYGDVFTQDSIDNITVNGLSFTSRGAASSAAPGTYNVTMSGTGTSTTGYATSYDSAAEFGELTVTPKPTPPMPTKSAVPPSVDPAIAASVIAEDLAATAEQKPKSQQDCNEGDTSFPCQLTP